jgi:hypothetical protein
MTMLVRFPQIYVFHTPGQKPAGFHNHKFTSSTPPNRFPQVPHQPEQYNNIAAAE